MVLVLVMIPPRPVPHHQLGGDGGASEVSRTVEDVEPRLVVPREEWGGGGLASPNQ